MNKITLSLLVTAVAVALLVACSVPTATNTDVPLKTATFEYTPAASTEKKANFTVAIMPPLYDKIFTYGGSSPFSSFQASLGGDIEEVARAKGFTVRGPYKGIDVMASDDKQQTEMVLEVTINPQLNTNGGTWISAYALCAQGGQGFRFKGPVVMAWKITITGTEPMSGTELWRKNIVMDPVTVPTDGGKGFCSRDVANLFQDPGFVNPLVDAMQVEYKKVMDKVSKQLEAEEFNALKAKINEIKSKNGH